MASSDEMCHQKPTTSKHFSCNPVQAHKKDLYKTTKDQDQSQDQQLRLGNPHPPKYSSL